MAKQVFKVPAGCREAMTTLHTAHTERFNRVVHKLKQMKVNQLEDHRLIGAFMDTHAVLRGALDTAMKHGKKMPDHVKDYLNAAAIHADDVHSSTVHNQRGAGVGNESRHFVEPQSHLMRIIDDIRRRRETPAERKRDEGEVPYHLIPVPKK